MYVGLLFKIPAYAWLVALFVLAVGVIFSIDYNCRLKADGDSASLARLNQKILREGKAGDQAAIAGYLSPELTILRDGARQDLQSFISDLAANHGHERNEDQVTVHLFDQRAVYTCRVTVTLKIQDQPVTESFWSTRMFARSGKDWYCTAWEEVKLPDNFTLKLNDQAIG